CPVLSPCWRDHESSRCDPPPCIRYRHGGLHASCPCGRPIDQATSQTNGHRHASWEASSKPIAVRLHTPLRCDLALHADVLLNLRDARRGVHAEGIRLNPRTTTTILAQASHGDP